MDTPRKCDECGREIPEGEASFMCDEPVAKEQYCSACFEKWGCEEKHSEGCMTMVF